MFQVGDRILYQTKLMIETARDPLLGVIAEITPGGYRLESGDIIPAEASYIRPADPVPAAAPAPPPPAAAPPPPAAAPRPAAAARRPPTLAPRPCERCLSVYQPRGNGQKYCLSCQLILKREWKRAYAGKHGAAKKAGAGQAPIVPALAASAAAFPCKRCGQPLEGSRRGGRIYCPTCKGEVDREHNRKTARASAERKAALVRAAAAVVVPPMPAVSRPLEAELTAGVGLEKTLAAFCAELRRAISTIRRAQYLQKILDSAEA